MGWEALIKYKNLHTSSPLASWGLSGSIWFGGFPPADFLSPLLRGFLDFSPGDFQSYFHYDKYIYHHGNPTFESPLELHLICSFAKINPRI